MASEEIASIDAKIRTKTFFIKSLTVDAQTLLAKATTEEIKAECKKVADALRFSDPMSNDGLSGIESEISIKFNEFADAVNANSEDVSTIAEDLIVLITDRNAKCKLFK